MIDNPEWPTTPEDEAAALQRLLAPPPPRILVVSDLHLNYGRTANTNRYARTENFLADDAFERWLRHEALAGPGLLVLNGDVFDFLRVSTYPRTDADFDAWSELLATHGVQRTAETLKRAISRKERSFGMQTDDYKSLWKLQIIIRGHGTFFRALGEWVAAGGAVLFVKGNHDLELHWPLVRRALRQAIHAHAARPEFDRSRIVFSEDPVVVSNVYIEHGHRYDKEQRIDGGAVLVGLPTQLNLPLASFVARYLVNPLERIEPFLDNIKPISSLLWAMLRRHPLQAIGLLWRSWRLLVRAAQSRKLVDSFSILIFLGSLLVPLITIVLVIGTMFWTRLSDWIERITNGNQVVFTVVGMLAPYIIGAIRELFPHRRPAIGDDAFAEGVYNTLKARSPAGSSWIAVMGHTHVRDVQWLVGDIRVSYINVGAWVPLWLEDRPDLIGRVFNPFVRLTLGESGTYTYHFLEWRDDRGEPVDTVILEPHS